MAYLEVHVPASAVPGSQISVLVDHEGVQVSAQVVVPADAVPGQTVLRLPLNSGPVHRAIRSEKRRRRALARGPQACCDMLWCCSDDPYRPCVYDARLNEGCRSYGYTGLHCAFLIVFVLLSIGLTLFRELYFQQFTSTAQIVESQMEFMDSQSDYLSHQLQKKYSNASRCASLAKNSTELFVEVSDDGDEYNIVLDSARAKDVMTCVTDMDPDDPVWSSLCSTDTVLSVGLSQEVEQSDCGINTPNPQGCAMGFYQPVDDMAGKPLRCPAGFICPNGVSCAILCPFGTYCPQFEFEVNSTTECGAKPAVMATVNARAILSTTSELTRANMTCPGSDAMFTCRAGFYCPSPDTAVLCPVRHYCPGGEWGPRRCPRFSLCTVEGLERPEGGVLALAVATFSLLVISWSAYLYQTLRLHLITRSRNIRLLPKQYTHDSVELRPLLGPSSDDDSDDSSQHGVQLTDRAPAIVRSPMTPLMGVDAGVAQRDDDGLDGLDDDGLDGLDDDDDDSVLQTAHRTRSFHSSLPTMKEYVYTSSLHQQHQEGDEAGGHQHRSQQHHQQGADALLCCGCDYYTHRNLAVSMALLLAVIVLVGAVDDGATGLELLPFPVLLLSVVGCCGLCILPPPVTDTLTPSSSSRWQRIFMGRGSDPHHHQQQLSWQRVRTHTDEDVEQPAAGLVVALPSFPLKTDDRIDLLFRDVTLVLNSTGQQLLQGVNGQCLAGTMTCILGGSGAGKTTLLNVLAGKASDGTMHGELRINGVKDSMIRCSNLVGFVPQDDIMHSELTVSEILTTYASLRQPRSSSTAHIEAVVDDVVEALGLERVRDTVVGDVVQRGISGGQKKRVNVGIEMVANPSVLFLDEPTSGLDSATSFDLVVALQALAAKGCNVIAVLHQPSYSIFETFHRTLLLAQGGRAVYHGRTADAKQYFTEQLGYSIPAFANPADYFLDCIASKVGPPPRLDPSTESKWPEEQIVDVLCAAWSYNRAQYEQAFPENFIPATPITARVLLARRPHGFWFALSAFMQRAVFQQLHTLPQFILDSLLHFCAGALVGFLFQSVTLSQIQPTMLMYAIGLGLTTGMTSLRVFGAERVVAWRESSVGAGMGLNRLAYFIAKNIVDLPRLFLLTTMTALSFYVQTRPLCGFGEFLLKSCAASWAVSGWAYLFSISLEHSSSQLTLIVAIVCFLLTSGVLPSLSSLVQRDFQYALSYLSFARWLTEDLSTAHVAQLGVAYRMLPGLYNNARTQSVVLWLLNTLFSDAFHIYHLPPFNTLMNLWIGLLTRVLSFEVFSRGNRSHGFPSIRFLLITKVVNPIQDWYRTKREESD